MNFLTSNQKISLKIAPLSIAIISTLACTQAFAEETVPEGFTIDQLSGVKIEEKFTVFNDGKPVTKTKFTNSHVKITELQPTVSNPKSSQANTTKGKADSSATINRQKVSNTAEPFFYVEPKNPPVFEPSVKTAQPKRPVTKVEEPVIVPVKPKQTKPMTVIIDEKPITVITKPVVEQPVVKPAIKPVINRPVTEPVVNKPITKPVVTNTVNHSTDGGEAGADNGTGAATLNNLQPSVRPGTRIYKLSEYAALVNSSKWSQDMKRNTAMTVKIQALLDWNHASPGPIDGGWGMNSKKALKNFQAMKGIEVTGKMNQATWDALTKNIADDELVLYSYKITHTDTKTKFQTIPSGYPAKSKLPAMEYTNIQEKMAERFQMDVKYLQKLNKGKIFKTGETITVYNASKPLKSKITKVVANKANETLYAYNGEKLVATYPTTVGSSATPSPHGTFKIVSKVKMPWYNATVGEGKEAKKYRIAPGPNNPVGVVWMGLSKPSFGLHGSPVPEGISRQASHGCIRLTNWDVLEVYDNIVRGAKVVLE